MLGHYQQSGHIILKIILFFRKNLYLFFICQILSKVSAGSQSYRSMPDFFFNFIFSCCQIWLNCLMDDCHFGITKFETKNPAWMSPMVNHAGLGFMVLKIKGL
jgi:hypothetical protein